MAINQDFINILKVSGQRLDVSPSLSGPTTLRRGFPVPSSSKVARLQLVMDEDGVLDWEEAASVIPGLARRRRGLNANSSDGAQLVEFPKLEPSKVTEFLSKQDDRMTPKRGLRAFDSVSGKLVPMKVPQTGKILLMVHGTFSNSDNVIQSFLNTKHGKEFLNSCIERYGKNIFFFDHPTISVGPIFNAIDLNRELGGTTAEIDIIAHSRGGLVTRWWCEACDPNGVRCKNAILVGSPLAGTGLAAPPNIRKTLRLLTNYGHALSLAASTASMAVPVVAVVNTLLQVITSFTSVAASTPIADSVMAMIPGLFGQSRVGNNPELLRLHLMQGKSERYAAVQSNFESEEIGWRFWKIFSGQRILDNATDIVFEGPNDMVVDTPSMTYLGERLLIAKERTHDFGKSSSVHHVNYFDHLATIEHFRKILKLV